MYPSLFFFVLTIVKFDIVVLSSEASVINSRGRQPLFIALSTDPTDFIEPVEENGVPELKRIDVARRTARIEK
jgi:hypothetical protein